MIGLTDRLAVQVLRKAGLTLQQVAGEVGVSKRSVQEILKEPPVTVSGGAATAKSRGVGRPSRVEAFRAAVAAGLAEEPSLPTVEVLHRLRVRGYTGQKSALTARVRRLRGKPKPEPPLVLFEGLAGEFSQHDFGRVDVSYADGSRERVHFFVWRLKFSRWTHVAVVPDGKVEALVRALLAGFEAFGGVPLRSVFDNPKTIVVRPTAGRPDWNPTFAQAVLDYGFVPELCTPGQPRQKGSVDNGVGGVKGSFFKGRRVHDREDLRAQLAGGLVEVNTERPSRATGEPPAARIGAERERLRPLAIPPADDALRIPVTARTTGLVEHAGIRYAMPPAAAGIPATLFLGPDRVRILTTNGLEAEPPRTPEAGTASYRSEDRVARLAAVHGARGKLYLPRQEIYELGPPGAALLTEWVHGGHCHWKNQVEALHALLVAPGAARVLEALGRALADPRYHVDAIAWLLDHSPSLNNNSSSSSEGLA